MFSPADKYNNIFKVGVSLPNRRPACFSALNSQKKLLAAILALWLLIIPAARAQLGQGTIVAIGLSEQKVIFAGDSRTLLTVRGEGFINDAECKVSAPSGKVIFFSTGIASKIASFGGWNIPSEVHRTLEGFTGDVYKAASLWETAMKKRLESLNITEAAENDILAQSGIAGLQSAGGLALLRVTFKRVKVGSEYRIDSAISPAIHLGKTMEYQVAGLGEIAIEFMSGNTSRAVAERQAWQAHSKAPDFDEFRVIRLVELTIEFHPRKNDVGGLADAVEITKDGTIHWIQRKPTCPEK